MMQSHPTGGGTGIIGMWNVFDELEKIGFIGCERPKMIVVQSSICQPIVNAFEDGERHAKPWPNAATNAAGIRVSAAIGDFLTLDAVYESNGFAIAIDNDDIQAALEEVAK
jgi:threonine synthase